MDLHLQNTIQFLKTVQEFCRIHGDQLCNRYMSQSTYLICVSGSEIIWGDQLYLSNTDPSW